MSGANNRYYGKIKLAAGFPLYIHGIKDSKTVVFTVRRYLDTKNESNPQKMAVIVKKKNACYGQTLLGYKKFKYSSEKCNQKKMQVIDHKLKVMHT